MSVRTYPYAIMRVFHPSDMLQRPYSCHLTAASAIRAAERESQDEKRGHGQPGAYVAVHWGATRRGLECWAACTEATA